MRCCKWRRVLFIVAVLLLFLITLEEHNHGIVFIRWQNYYGKEIRRPITVRRTDTSQDIAMVVVVEGGRHQAEYVLARRTLQCYAQLQSYPLYILDTTKDPTYGGKCRHKDFMFKRHCVLGHFMSQSNHSWFLFLDGDIGVVNPNHLLEKYLPSSKYSMVFYKRVMNHEIMAGTYLARNDAFSRKFLLNWADYEYKTPNSFHGTDNGAIHSVLADLAVPGDVSHRNLCSHLWNISSGYEGLSHYEVCLQLYLEKFAPPRVHILEKGRLAWSRDGWLTNSKWSHKDFMFHGWQKKRKDRRIFARWHSPLVEGTFNVDKCTDPWTAAEQWRYKDSFIRSDIELDQIIFDKIKSLSVDFIKHSDELHKQLEKE